MHTPGEHTATMAAFAAGYSDRGLPADAVARSKEIVLDTIGAILLGSRPVYRGVEALCGLARVSAANADAQSTVFGRGFRAPLLDALLANGTMGYAADAEGAGGARMHAAALFVPVVLTLGEHMHAPGRTAIEALALAYDAAFRISDAADPGTPYPHSFHPSAVFGHFGAAAAAGHLLGLNENQFVNALGLAGINAGGLIAWVDDPTEDSRPFVIGAAAQAGARAALLAKQGMGGPQRILDEAKYSIYDAFSGEAHLERLAARPGDRPRILDAGGYKRWTSCADIHSGIDALLALMERHRLHADQVESITHRVRPDRVDIIDDNPLRSHRSQYILAVAAATGGIEPDDILMDRAATDPEIARLQARVTLVADPSLSDVTGDPPAIIEVRTADGRTCSERVDHPKGSRANPFTRDEIEQKFMRWATTRIPGPQARQIIALTTRLETLPDIAPLTRLLAT